MFGILSQQSRSYLMTVDDLAKNVGGGGGAMTSSVSPTPSTSPMQGGTDNFDLSVLQGLKPSQKYGTNLVSDIQSSYQTYITGSPVGKGGQYALSSAQKYGVSLVDAARGYLIGAGIPILPSATQTQTTNTTTTDTTVTDTTQKNPFQVLADVLPSLFGNAVYNPPLQSQTYGYTPTSTEQPLTQATSGGSSIGLLIIVGVIGVVGYFVYKRFVK